MQDPIDRRIARAAARRHTIVTRHQLLELGLGAKAISYRARSGRLFREHDGVYAVGKPATSPLERASAAVLACGDGAALSHGSAMVHWGWWRRWEEPFEVTTTGTRRRPGIIVHRSRILVPARDTVVHNGIRVTKPARTVLDMTPRLDDNQLARAIDTALLSPYLTRSQLQGEIGRHTRGVARLLPFLTTASGPSRSDWERAFPAFCVTWDLPVPVLNVRAGTKHTVDARFPGYDLLVELDSWEFHQGRAAFETDRDRDADHLALGVPTLRITWWRMHNTAEREATRLHAILAKCRRAA
jgi:hypothetical protein